VALIDGSLVERPRLLVLRALGLGDFLTGVPALRALRRALPDRELVLAAPPVLDPLVSLAGVADRLHPAFGLQPVAWPEEPPELAVNLHGRGPQSHELLRALHPGDLVAFGNAEASVEGPVFDPEEHEVRRWCRLLEEALDIPSDPTDLVLPAPRTDPAVPDAVVVHPGAAYPSRRWPADRFAQVARWAVDAGHEVVVTGGPDEIALAGEVRRLAGLPAGSVLAGRTDLTQLATQIASAQLVVCGDTGVAHLASAFATPSVVLFGPVSPDLWGPPARGPHTMIWHGDGAGDPWADHPDEALMSITVDEVVEAAEALLAGLRG
jgi:ADP-heptose:LPS heptosyltransferase